MKEKALRIAELIAPILLIVWFPYRFWVNVIHYQSHAEDFLTPIIGFVCAVVCAVMVYRACRNHAWIMVILYGLLALSALFFSYCIWQIPFCTECDHITRNDLHPLLKPFEERFAPYWGE